MAISLGSEMAVTNFIYPGDHMVRSLGIYISAIVCAASLLCFSSGKSLASVGAIKLLQPDSEAELIGVSVSAIRPGFFYVQKPDQPVGIRVNSSVEVQPGDVLDIRGLVSISAHELVIEAASVTKVGASRHIAPVCMRMEEIGGSALGYQKGVTSGKGLNTIGLLIRTWGTVGHKAPGAVWLRGDFNNTGSLKLICNPDQFQTGQKVVVGGVVSLEEDSVGNILPVLFVTETVKVVTPKGVFLSLRSEGSALEGRQVRLVLKDGGQYAGWLSQAEGIQTLDQSPFLLRAYDTANNAEVPLWIEEASANRLVAWVRLPSSFSGYLHLSWASEPKPYNPWEVIQAGLNPAVRHTVGKTMPWISVISGGSVHDGVTCNYNHVPVLRYLPNGQLYLIWSAGPFDEFTNAGQKVLMHSFSSDGGSTWSKPERVPIQQDAANRYPTALFVKGSKVTLVYNEWPLLQYNKGTLSIAHSQDNGQTWSEPRRITEIEDVTANQGGTIVNWNGKEHWLFTVYDEEFPGRAFLLDSEDEGENWRVRQISSPGGYLLRLEPAFAADDKGNIVVYTRTRSENLYRCFSSDHGETWTEWEKSEQAIQPQSKPEILHLGGTKIVLANNDWRGPTRRNLVLMVSEDYGRTFDRYIGIFDGTSMGVGHYPSLIQDRNGDLLLAFTGGKTAGPIPNSSILFVRIPGQMLDYGQHAHSVGNAFPSGYDSVVFTENGQGLWLRPPYIAHPAPEYPLRFSVRFFVPSFNWRHIGWQFIQLNSYGPGLPSHGYTTHFIVGRRAWGTANDGNFAVHNGSGWVQTEYPIPKDREFELSVVFTNPSDFSIAVDGITFYNGSSTVANAHPLLFYLGSTWPNAGPFGFPLQIKAVTASSNPVLDPLITGL